MNKNTFGLAQPIFVSLVLIAVCTTIYASSFAAMLGRNQSAQKSTTTVNKLKVYALDKASQAIEDYLNYTTTNQTDYVVDGIKHAVEAKLFLDSYVQKLPKPADNELLEFIDALSRLSDDIPKDIFKQHPLQDMRSFATYIGILKVMLKKVRENPN